MKLIASAAVVAATGLELLDQTHLLLRNQLNPSHTGQSQ